ncbi:hypothetical protein FRACYDRAFT_242208 [Fragilariopsis cylindrus CCMP1102]|uniref:Uncharacterized protein n=1 Tax=Fragilariopsis cylindrus CCMP1102 TaxID=635003 RepID=A0A1E7F6S8_9STRA|nr:hypothetical protein FRACYDRAFT_242208 [Fragilariopsis cylindrus CCMP1102]|eukprot:OEU13857.1 hypothetical protein FRACYDRAFT_242208 [Fragilariopsis cylindrus CCMP1102]
MSPSRRSVVDDDGNDNDSDNDIDNDIDHDDGTKKCTRCIRGPTASTENVTTKTTNNNTKSPESDPDPELEGINGKAEAIFTKEAINTTKSPTELEPELEEQQQRKRKKVITTNTTTNIRIKTTTRTTRTRRVDDGTKECTRCVRGPKYKHGHDITCQRSQFTNLQFTIYNFFPY